MKRKSKRGAALARPTLEAHPLAAAFPMLGEAGLADLGADIMQQGLLHPIVTLDGKILDGRNRQAACALVGVKPRFVPFDGVDPLRAVLSMNVQRRHLSGSQRALVAGRLTSLRFDPEAANLPVPTQAQAAEQLGVSERSVRHACAVLERGVPELVAAIDRGELAVSAGADLAKFDPQQQLEVLEAAIECTRAHEGKTINVRGLVAAAQRDADPALSQWDTPPELARRMAAWLGLGRRKAPRVLEPSAGRGALVRAVLEAYPRAEIVAVEIDAGRVAELVQINRELLAAATGDVHAFGGAHPCRVDIVEGDYLEQPPIPCDAAIANPPFDDGVEVEHVAKMLDDARDRIALHLPTRSLHGGTRYERIWSRIGVDWWIRREARLVTRAKYAGDGGRDETLALLLTREPGDCVLEWWELGE